MSLEKQHCPFHPNDKPLIFRTTLSRNFSRGFTENRFIKDMMCGHKGCTTSWKEDATEEMVREFNA